MLNDGKSKRNLFFLLDGCLKRNIFLHVRGGEEESMVLLWGVKIRFSAMVSYEGRETFEFIAKTCIQIYIFCNWVVVTTHTLITLALIWGIIKHRSPSGLLVILGNFAFSLHSQFAHSLLFLMVDFLLCLGSSGSGLLAHKMSDHSYRY